MVFKIVVIIAIFAIIFSLGSGMVFLLKDKSGSKRTVKALTFRIGLSVALFVLLLVAFALGWITPHGV